MTRSFCLLAVGCALALRSAEAASPFRDALASADVRISDLQPAKATENLRNGPVIGNGELNAIVYVAGQDLMLRVSKNDVWDGRIDTSADPALPRIDPHARPTAWLAN